MGYMIGIDQGASKTEAIVADEKGNILGRGISDGSCYASNGIENAMAMIKEAYSLALKNANVRMEGVTTLTSGMTGADWPHEYIYLKEALQKVSGIREVEVFNDCVIALRGGTEQSYGAVICAGSGLNVAVKTPTGKLHVFGYYIDDGDTGGNALGKIAIRSVLASSTGVLKPTKLTEAALGFYRVDTTDDLLYHYVNRKISDKMIRSFVPTLFDVALNGDSIALDIIGQFGQRVAKYIIADFEKFDMLLLETEIILSGSIFKDKNPILVDAVTLAIHSRAPKAIIKNALYEPVVGAILVTLDSQNDHQISEEIKNNIYRTSEKLGLLRLIKT